MARLPRVAALVVAVAGLVAAVYAQLQLVGGVEAARWGLLAAAVATAVASWASLRGRPASLWREAPRLAEVVAVGGLLAAGIWLRVVGFDRVPSGMNHDAAWNGMYATAIRSGAEYTPYVAAAWGRETLFMYLIAPFQEWLGISAAAVQAASIVAGVAALIPLYLLARDLFGRAAGLAALAFFAASGWHWVFSEVGWRCITVPPLETLALLFLWRSLERGGWARWLGAGAFAAASIYTYNAGRIVPAMVAVLALWYLAFHRDRWRSILGGGGLAAAAFAAVGGPMLWYAANNWAKFQGRAAHLLDQSQRQTGLAENLWSALWMFNLSANGNDFFLAEPLLETLAAALFVIGLAVLALRIRRPEAQFVLVGFAMALVPGLLSFPNGNRCITAMPFVYVTVGLAAAQLARSFSSLLRAGAARWVAVALLTLAFASAFYATYTAYVGARRLPLHGVSADATAAGEFLGRFGEDYRAYAVSGAWPRYTLLYLGYTHGDPLEPDIVLGRTFAEIERQLSRYGRKGVVLVGDLSPAGEEARRGIKTIFADAREEPVPAARLGGQVVARAVVVEPREAVRTAPWSNRTRVLAVGPGVDGGAAGAHCTAPRSTESGFSVRFRIMVPEQPAAGGGRFELLSACPAPSAAARFSISGKGLVLDAPTGVVLVEPSDLQVGRWYDLGMAIDRTGRTRVLVDGKVVDLGPWHERPARIAGFAVGVSGAADGMPKLYVDDFATIRENVPPESPWWQVEPREGDLKTEIETFEGLPVGDLAGRPGWHGGDLRWAVRSGPAGPGAGDEETTNAFDGGHGTSPGKFDEPMGVGIDRHGNIYVSERLNHRVQKFSADGTYVGEWGVLGSAPGEFREPLDLAVDGDRVYVMDTWNTRLQVFDLTGNYLFQIGPDPEIGKPRGIFVRDGRIYLANSGRDNILVYDTDGKAVAKFPPPEGSTLQQVVDLVVDSKGRIYVNNSQGGRIEIFSASGERLGALPVADWDAESLKEFYMAIDGDDVIYISDWGLSRVRRMRTDGTELPAIGPKMNRPSGLALFGNRLIVAARGDNALRAIDVP